MKQFTFTIIFVFCLLGYCEKAFAQEFPLPYNDSVPEPKVDSIKDISQGFLDSLSLKTVSVETHLGYCDDAKPAIILHKQHGAAIVSYLGPGCPLRFTPKKEAKEVNITFTGCAGKYKLVGYDSAKNKIVENTVEIELWAFGKISIRIDTPNIAFVTFARGTGCSTYVKSIKFE